MLIIHFTHAAYLVDSGFIVEVTNQGITGIGGHSQNPALAQQGHRLFEQTGLRIVGMDLQPLGHSENAQRRGYWMRSASSSQTGVKLPGSQGRLPRSVWLSSGL